MRNFERGYSISPPVSRDCDLIQLAADRVTIGSVHLIHLPGIHTTRELEPVEPMLLILFSALQIAWARSAAAFTSDPRHLRQPVPSSSAPVEFEFPQIFPDTNPVDAKLHKAFKGYQAKHTERMIQREVGHAGAILWLFSPAIPSHRHPPPPPGHPGAHGTQ